MHYLSFISLVNCAVHHTCEQTHSMVMSFCICTVRQRGRVCFFDTNIAEQNQTLHWLSSEHSLCDPFIVKTVVVQYNTGVRQLYQSSKSICMSETQYSWLACQRKITACRHAPMVSILTYACVQGEQQRSFMECTDIPCTSTVVRKTIHEYFEQVLQNSKKMDAEQCPYSVVAFVIDRKYKYGWPFVRYQVVTKFSWF